jgi:hypothetical protein
MQPPKPAIAVYFDPDHDRRRRPPSDAPARFDPRPASPGWLASVGLAVWAIGTLVPAVGALALLGVLCLLVAVAGQAIKPRSPTVYVRGRPVELDTAAPRRRQLYYAVFKR